MIQTADAFAWDGMRAAIGRMNKPMGSKRQEKFLDRAAIEYLARFVLGMKKEAIRRVDSQETQMPSKGECLALIHVTGRVLDWIEEERSA